MYVCAHIYIYIYISVGAAQDKREIRKVVVRAPAEKKRKNWNERITKKEQH